MAGLGTPWPSEVTDTKSALSTVNKIINEGMAIEVAQDGLRRMMVSEVRQEVGVGRRQ
jgi:hypothetical protein